MKIAIISNLYPPNVLGGAEKYVESISKELAKSNDVLVITTKSPSTKYKADRQIKRHIQEGLNIIEINTKNIYNISDFSKKSAIIKPIWHLIDIWNPFVYLQLKQILNAEKPDVVHVHNIQGLSISVFCAIKAIGIPCIFTLHDYYLLCIKTNLLNECGEICDNDPLPCKAIMLLKRNIIDSIPLIVIAPSQFVLDRHIKNRFFPNSKKIKFSLGIGLDKNKQTHKNYDTLDILYVGQLSKHKGVHILIKAFRLVGNLDIRLNIVGKGHDSEYFQKLAGNDSRIIFRGFVSDKRLKELYKLANVVVVPSVWYDNSPVVIYESFTNGNLVIGSNIGGIPELIEHGKNGFLFEAGNVDEIKDILENLIKNPNEIKRLGNNAIKSAKKYDMYDHIRKLENMYERVLGS